ncbi:MAG: energy transducer TonB [Pseudomonadota bacterium]
MFFAPPVVKNLTNYSEFGSHLGNRHFLLTILAAIFIHAAIVIIASWTPSEEPMPIAVRVLNIKFSGNAAENVESPKSITMPDLGNNIQNENPEHNVDSQKQASENNKNQIIEILTKSTDKKGHNKTESQEKEQKSKPKKYYRESELNSNKSGKEYGNGSGIKGSGDGQEVVSKYEQEISLWMAKYKKYPESAKKSSLEGIAVIRIRINREGHVIYSGIDTSSGIVAIDEAVIAMVRDADPLPRVPDNYPEGSELEFLIPVSFKLQ